MAATRPIQPTQDRIRQLIRPSLMAIPFFIYAGELMNQSGIAARLVRFAHSLLGQARGGLGQVNVLASMMFGAISGSAVASSVGHRLSIDSGDEKGGL